jgi:hypothetical protein
MAPQSVCEADEMNRLESHKSFIDKVIGKQDSHQGLVK